MSIFIDHPVPFMHENCFVLLWSFLGLPDRVYLRIHSQIGVQIRAQLEHAWLRQLHFGYFARWRLDRCQSDRMSLSGLQGHSRHIHAHALEDPGLKIGLRYHFWGKARIWGWCKQWGSLTLLASDLFRGLLFYPWTFLSQGPTFNVVKKNWKLQRTLSCLSRCTYFCSCGHKRWKLSLKKY